MMTEQPLTNLPKQDGVTVKPPLRNAGIDLLRMVSMYMVCMIHVLGEGGILEHTKAEPANYAVGWFFMIAAMCAVNCFALISGYVGVTATFRYRNIIRLWLQAVFYSVGLTVAFYVVNPKAVGLKGLLLSCFPICTNEYWYLSAYALMFFAIPQMNFIVSKQDKHAVKRFIWTFFIFFSLCSLLPVVRGISQPVKAGYSAVWLAYLYGVGGYIRLYGIGELFHVSDRLPVCDRMARWTDAVWKTQGRRLCMYVLCVMIAFIIRCGVHQLVKSFFGSDPFCYQVVTYNSPLILLAGMALLVFFADLDVTRWSAFIRMASPLAFSVYLIQNQRYVWRNMFVGAFAGCAELSPVVLPFAILGLPLVIYAVCSAIDYLRMRLFRLFKL